MMHGTNNDKRSMYYSEITHAINSKRRSTETHIERQEEELMFTHITNRNSQAEDDLHTRRHDEM